MKRAHKTRIVEKNLSEHIRQENAAYRRAIRETMLAEADRRLLESAKLLASSAAADVASSEPHTATSLQMIATAIHTVLKG